MLKNEYGVKIMALSNAQKQENKIAKASAKDAVIDFLQNALKDPEYNFAAFHDEYEALAAYKKYRFTKNAYMGQSAPFNDGLSHHVTEPIYRDIVDTRTYEVPLAEIVSPSVIQIIEALVKAKSLADQKDSYGRLKSAVNVEKPSTLNDYTSFLEQSDYEAEDFASFEPRSLGAIIDGILSEYIDDIEELTLSRTIEVLTIHADVMKWFNHETLSSGRLSELKESLKFGISKALRGDDQEPKALAKIFDIAREGLSNIGQDVKAAERLGIDPYQVSQAAQVKQSDYISKQVETISKATLERLGL